MADVVITIPVTSVQYTTWLRTSYIGLSLVSDAGTPLVEQNELGPDQEDALNNFLDEASREVAKLFISRQGDAAGIPFEYDGSNAIYRFNEEEPVLNQAISIKSALNEDVKNAIFAWVTYLWFKLKGSVDHASGMMSKYQRLSIDIQGHIHRLHD